MSPMGKTKSMLLPLFLVLSSVLIGGAAGLIAYSFWDLPEVRSLEEYRPSITSKVYSDDNRLLAEFFVENRTPVALAGVPGPFLQALIATEDSRFYRHPGIDVRGIARAMYRNLRAGEIREGGSTLTQQLSKVLFLTPEKSYMRKLKEMALALRIEQRALVLPVLHHPAHLEAHRRFLPGVPHAEVDDRLRIVVEHVRPRRAEAAHVAEAVCAPADVA